MTSYDRDSKKWVFEAEITFTTYIEVDTDIDEREAIQKGTQALSEDFLDAVQGMELGGADWPSQPSVTLLDGHGLGVVVL